MCSRLLLEIAFGAMTLPSTLSSFVAWVLFSVVSPFLTLSSVFRRYYLHLCRPQFSPADKVILITGASSGIGASLACEYANLGASLVLVARRDRELNIVGNKCREIGAKEVVCVVGDLEKESDCRGVVDTALSLSGKLDLLILNAGIFMAETFADLCAPTASSSNTAGDISVIKKVMDVNFLASVQITALALPHILKSTGRIAVISSLFGLAGVPTASGYCASKFALKGFFDSLRMEQPNIPITLVYPDLIATDLGRTSLGSRCLQFNKGRSPQVAAHEIMRAIKIGKRDEALGINGKVGYWLGNLAPEFRDFSIALQMRNALASPTPSDMKQM